MDLQAQADAFRAQACGDDVDPAWDLLKGMTLPKSFKTPYAHPQAPVFTHMLDNRFPVLYQVPDFAVYLNSGLPYLDAYPGNEGRAAMSFVHLLVVPRERIYNVKTLRKTDEGLLRDMYHTTLDLFTRPQFIDTLELALLKQNLLDVSGDVLTYENREAFVRSMHLLKKVDPEAELSMWFHEHPNHSVGHLHMHVLLDTALTDAFKIHEKKNIPYDDVMNRLKSMP